MKTGNFTILLADDDPDDCFLFKEALKELAIPALFETVHDGAELIRLLENNTGRLPDVLFMDLNMPLKTGFDCLAEIKHNNRLKHLPVIIYSTSYDPDAVDVLYNSGAQHYIRKPTTFESLKKVIDQALAIVRKNNLTQPPKEKFVLLA